MNIRAMHFAVKTQLNKLDSGRFRDLRVPEIDWQLNLAQDILIKLIAFPRLFKGLGFESSQRTTDDLSSIIVEDTVRVSVESNKVFVVPLPKDLMYTLSLDVKLQKDECPEVDTTVTLVQHEDNVTKSIYQQPNYHWGVVKGRMTSEGVKVFTDGTFAITGAKYHYLKTPRKVCNAPDYPGGVYRSPYTNLPISVAIDCELPESVHSEVVNIAVMLISGDLQMSNLLQTSISKNQLITLN